MEREGVSIARVRRLLLALPGVEAGRSYGLPSFLLRGKFLARFRDDDTVLVVKVGTMDERDLLLQLDPVAFFVTDHYRDYPAVLIRLAAVRWKLLADVVRGAHAQAVADVRRPRARKLRARPRSGRKARRARDA